MSRHRRRKKNRGYQQREPMTTKVAQGIKSTATFLFVPQRGDRKVHVTMWVLGAGVSLFLLSLIVLQPDFKDWINSLVEFFKWIIGIFVGGNATENVTTAVLNRNGNGKNGNGNGNGNQQQAPVPAPPPPNQAPPPNYPAPPVPPPPNR